MDYTQVEEQFKSLKKQFEAGKLDETAFKSRLNELMVQDGQGRWWMIGYETGQWYVHDGSAWVRSEPPEKARAADEPAVQEPAQVEEPPDTSRAEKMEPLPELDQDQPASEPMVQEPEQTEEPLPDPVQTHIPAEPAITESVQAEKLSSVIQEVQAPSQMAEMPAVKAEVKKSGVQTTAKPVGFIANRGREALLVLIGAVAFSIEGFSQSPHIFMLFGLIPSLSGIFFGPWVGGLTGALGELLAFAVFSANGNGSYDPIHFMIFSAFSGVISGLLVKDAKNWKIVLYASLMARVPLFMGDFVRQAEGIGEFYFADWFINRLVDFLLPGLLLIPLVARALIDTVKDRGWYWLDAPSPHRVLKWDWNTIILFTVVWSTLWSLIYGLVIRFGDLSNSWFIVGGICGIASGLTAGLILRRVFSELGAAQILLITAGWCIGFLAAAHEFMNMVAYGYVNFEDIFIFLLMGIAGGAGMSIALRWAGIFTDWRQALYSSIIWTIGLAVFAFLAGVLSDTFGYRLAITGLLIGAVGAWGIFWQSRPAGQSAEIR